MPNGKMFQAVLGAIMRGENPPPFDIVPAKYQGVEYPIWEPDDFKELDVAADIPVYASSGGVGSGGVEVKFNHEGIIVPGPGSTGVYWSRALRQRWAPIASGRMIAYRPEAAFYVATMTGGIPPGGVLSLEFYVKPRNVSWPDWREWVEKWTRGQMSGGNEGGGSGGTTAATSVALIIKGYDGVTYDSRALPGTGRRYVQPALDTGTPPGTNNPAAVFCVASSAALSQAGSGVLILPGGTYEWPGGPGYVTEIADLGSASDQVVNVVY